MLELIRDDDKLAGKIDRLAVCAAGPGGAHGMIVTAVRDGDGKLSLTAWQANENFSGMPVVQLSQKGTSTAHLIGDVAVVWSRYVVTAVRTSDDLLKLIAWEVTKDGAINRKGSAGKPDKITGRVAVESNATDVVAANSTTLIVTAVRLQNGTVRLSSWHLKDNGDIESLHDQDAGTGSEVALVSIGPDYAFPNVTQVFAALRDGGGNLKLIQYSLDKDGHFKQLATNSAGPIDEVDACIYSQGLSVGFSDDSYDIVTAVRKGTSLKLIGWRVDLFGEIKRIGPSKELPAGGKLVVTPVGVAMYSDRLLTAARDGAGNLALTVWNPDSSQFLVHEASNSAGAVSDIAVQSYGANGLATAVRQADGNLKVIAWHTKMP